MLSGSNIHYDVDGHHSGISCGGIGIVDGTITPTTGECKEGMDISYDGQWGYHPLVVSLAGAREPLASSPSSATGMKTPLLGIAAGMLFVGLILVVLVYFDVHEQLVELLEWIDAQGAMAAVFFILLMAAVVVLLVFTHHTLFEQYTHYVPGDSPAMKRFIIELSTRYANLADQVIAPSESIRDMLIERGVTSPVHSMR